MANNGKGGVSNRGFAAMDTQKQKEIARKGGEAVSRNRQHMAEIGREGGATVSKDRRHMAEIGREGGKASHGANRGNHEKSPAASKKSGQK